MAIARNAVKHDRQRIASCLFKPGLSVRIDKTGFNTAFNGDFLEYGHLNNPPP
jgi:hypothetical protein